MSLFANRDVEGMSEPPLPKAPQACMSCRKQKRKCSKTLPACALCQRMSRHCDYSEAAPAPTSEDFHILRMKLADLESRLRCGQRVFIQPDSYASSGGISGQDGQIGQLQQVSGFTPSRDVSWLGIQNRFPSIVFLHSDAFNSGGISVPRPVFDTPPDMLEVIGSGINVQSFISSYFATVHQWIPILSKKKLTRNLAKPLWELDSDIILLFLCMKLVISRPKDGLDCAQSEIYLAAKRFIILMESTGMISLHVLQANLLITIYEYGHAIYPAAWMSSGWSIRYGNLLGLSGDKSATNLLGKPSNSIDEEERIRTWWGVLLVDRIISIGNMNYIINSQEPGVEDRLPVDDGAWDRGEILDVPQLTVSTPISEEASPFSRFCQAYILLGQVMTHQKADSSISTTRFARASQLFTEITNLSREIAAEASSSKDFFCIIPSWALTYSSLCYLCNLYCYIGNDGDDEQRRVQELAKDGLKSTATSIIDFSGQVSISSQTLQDIDRVSPLIMDGLYAGALTLVWLAKENGDKNFQTGLGSLRECLSKLSTRWRNAADYVRILEAHEFAFALTQNLT